MNPSSPHPPTPDGRDQKSAGPASPTLPGGGPNDAAAADHRPGGGPNDAAAADHRPGGGRDRAGAASASPDRDSAERSGLPPVAGKRTSTEPAGAGSGRAAPRAGGRELGAVAAVCAVGGGMVLFAVGPTWVEVVAHRASPLPDVTLAVSGRSLAPLVAGLGIVGLAGVVGLLATRRWGRLIVAAIVALSGLGVLAGALTRLTAPGAAEARALLDDAGRSAGAAAVTATAHPGWPLLAAAGGLLLALGGLAALLRSRRWPTMSARYETPAARTDRPRTDAAVWDALDRGDDPTVSP